MPLPAILAAAGPVISGLLGKAGGAIGAGALSGLESGSAGLISNLLGGQNAGGMEQDEMAKLLASLQSKNQVQNQGFSVPTPGGF